MDKFVQVPEIFKITSQRISKSNLAPWQDEAMVYVLLLSVARASAAATLPIKAVHLNDEHPCIEQKPELGVRTKNGKATTPYIHIIPDLLDFARGWGEQSAKILALRKNRNIELGKRLRIISAINHLPYKSPHQYRHIQSHKHLVSYPLRYSLVGISAPRT